MASNNPTVIPKLNSASSKYCFRKLSCAPVVVSQFALAPYCPCTR